MSATAVLVIVVGIFVIVNAANFVGVIQGNKKINFSGAKPTGSSPVATAGRQ